MILKESKNRMSSEMFFVNPPLSTKEFTRTKNLKEMYFSFAMGTTRIAVRIAPVEHCTCPMNVIVDYVVCNHCDEVVGLFLPIKLRMSPAFYFFTLITMVKNFLLFLFEWFFAIPAIIDRFFWYWRVTSEKTLALFLVKFIHDYFIQLFDKRFETVLFSFDSVRLNFVILMLNDKKRTATGDLFFQIHPSTGIWFRSTCMDRNARGISAKIINKRYKPNGFSAFELVWLFLIIG